MPAIVGNISMHLGEDLPLIDQIYEADGVTPQNVTGWSATFTVYPPSDPLTVVIEKSTALGTITFSNPTASPPVSYDWALNLTVLNADTVASDGQPVVLPGTYGYRYTRTDSGNNTVVTVGLFTIAP